MDWDQIMVIENPHEALMQIAEKVDTENLSIQEMEDRTKMSKLRKWIIYRKWCKDKATLEEFRAAGGLPEMLRMAGIKPCPPEEATRHIYRSGPMGFSLWIK